MKSSGSQKAGMPILAGAQRVARAPLFWHLTTLTFGFVFIMALQRTQWFFFDEWAFLEPNSPGLLEPHVGHWSTSPLWLFHTFRDTFGLDSYLPFALTVTLVHLSIAHLIWRVCLRGGAEPWISTTGVAVFVFLGSGAENILWGFQIGFLSAIALGLFAFLLAGGTTLSRGRFAAVLSLSLFSLTWSGTAIPLVAATAVMIWVRHDKRRSIVFVVPTALVYGAWYAFFAVGSIHNPNTGGLGLEKVFVKIPEFLGVMFLLGWQSVFPLFGIGAVVLIAGAVWLLRLRKRRERLPGFSLPLVLAGAMLLFAFMSAYSRAEMSIGAGRSSRYLYVLVLLLLPLCTVALTYLTQKRPAWIAWTCVALIGLCGFQAVKLHSEAEGQAEKETRSSHLISAALFLYASDPEGVDLSVRPDAEWAPDVTLADLVELYEQGTLPIDDFDPSDLEEVREVVAVMP